MVLKLDNDNMHNALRDVVAKHFGASHQTLSNADGIIISGNSYNFVFSINFLEHWHGKKEEIINNLDKLFGHEKKFEPNHKYTFTNGMHYDTVDL